MTVEADVSAFVAARWSRMVRAAALLGCSPSSAEDAVQVALMQVCKSWQRVISAEDPEAYVYRILCNTVRRQHRKRRIAELLVGKETDVEQHAEAVGSKDWAMELDIQRALLGLAAGQREVIVMRYYVGYTERQVSELLNLPIGTVKSRHARGLKMLSSLIDRDYVRIED